jgi:biotin carboxylase
MVSSSPRILVVACGFPQLGLLRFCRANGLFVVGVDANPAAVGVRECDAFAQVSTRDTEGIVRAAREHDVAGLTTCGAEHALHSTATAAERLSLPFYADPDTVRACQRKDLMRDRYRAGGAPSPAHRVVLDRQEAEEFAATQGFPLVVKPAGGWGQRGVRVIMEACEFPAAVMQALDVSGDVDGPGRCVLERFVEGREYSVNAYTHAGKTEVLCVTERIITSYPDPPGITFAEAFPSELDADEHVAVVDAAIRGLHALGVQRGPTYTQVRSGPGGAHLVETALRLGGGLDPDVTYLATGISLYRRIVGVALGRDDWETAGREAEAHGGAVGRFIVAEPGRVEAVDGLTEARELPGIVGAEVYVQPGDTVHPLTDGSKRAGHVLAVGRDRDEAERHAAEAMRRIRIVTGAGP